MGHLLWRLQLLCLLRARWTNFNSHPKFPTLNDMLLILCIFFFLKKSIFGHKAYIFAVGMPTSSSNSFQSTLFIKRLYRLHIHSGCCLCRCITLLCNDMYFAYTCIYNYYVSALLVVGAVVRLCIKAPLFPLNCVGCLFK